MDQPTLTDASNVALLLCSHLGAAVDETSDETLGPTNWHDFRTKVTETTLESVGELLVLEPSEWPAKLFSEKINRTWVEERLSNASRLALELEELNQSGIWVTTEFEETFPTRLTDTLGRKAPPFLYVAGEAVNFQPKGVGFVGSRTADETDIAYTRDLVDIAIQDGFSIVSGGAKGVDNASEEEGLVQGGPVIEFPAEGIKDRLSNTDIREAVLDGTLTVASMYRPDASWSVGGAMGRNKLIHGFGKYTIAVRSGNETGGTWEGSTENLSNGWSLLLVCNHNKDAQGNKKLISKGGVPINPESKAAVDSFSGWIEKKIDISTDIYSNDDSRSSTDSNKEGNVSSQTSLEEF